MNETSVDTKAAQIVEALAPLAASQRRSLVAIAGPPASGKSTVASAAWELAQSRGISCGLVAMDGFHLANEVLDERGLRPRKGAPETFDLAGFDALLRRLQSEDEVLAPIFDRELDAAISSAMVIRADQKIVLVEGNYLLLDEPGWRDLARHWTLSFFLDVDEAVLEQRSIERWLSHGFDADQARQKAQGNDLPNARRVIHNRVPADMVIGLTTLQNFRI